MVEAVSAPRFSATSDAIDISNRIPRRVERELQGQGYEVVRSPYTFGFAAVHAHPRPRGRARRRRRPRPRRCGNCHITAGPTGPSFPREFSVQGGVHVGRGYEPHCRISRQGQREEALADSAETHRAGPRPAALGQSCRAGHVGAAVHPAAGRGALPAHAAGRALPCRLRLHDEEARDRDRRRGRRRRARSPCSSWAGGSPALRQRTCSTTRRRPGGRSSSCCRPPRTPALLRPASHASGGPGRSWPPRDCGRR